jgi:hypothetical protein
MDRPANDLSGTRLPVALTRIWSGPLTSWRRIGWRARRPVKGLAWRMTARLTRPKLRKRRRGAHRDEQGRVDKTHEKPVSGGGQCSGGVRENSFKTGGTRW